MEQVISVVHTTVDLQGSPFILRVYHIGGSLYNIHLDGANVVFSLASLNGLEFGTDYPMWFGISAGIPK